MFQSWGKSELEVAGVAARSGTGLDRECENWVATDLFVVRGLSGKGMPRGPGLGEERFRSGGTGPERQETASAVRCAPGVAGNRVYMFARARVCV